MKEKDRYLTGLTPMERYGKVWVKRDDLFMVGGASGGKARSCWALSHGALGLVTAGSRASPQVNIVARIAAKLGVPCVAHTPSGELSFPLLEAREKFGATIVQHKAGYNSVIIARAREDAKARGWTEIPFGMECPTAIEQTGGQFKDVPAGVKRIVVPVGSGISLAGVVHGMVRNNRKIPVVGLMVGAHPGERLKRSLPFGCCGHVRLIRSPRKYDEAYPEPEWNGIMLDPIYEAKCIPYLRDGDLFWVVGVRTGV